jgi:hypothetical protein
MPQLEVENFRQTGGLGPCVSPKFCMEAPADPLRCIQSEEFCSNFQSKAASGDHRS